jgi:hypothetical protein
MSDEETQEYTSFPESSEESTGNVTVRLVEGSPFISFQSGDTVVTREGVSVSPGEAEELLAQAQNNSINLEVVPE